MALKRLIARLDIKNATVIKGVMMEGLRVVGEPGEFARKYYQSGIDEILYIDAVASLYGRSSLFDLIQKATSEVFVPLTVGGGIRSLEDATRMLESGAEKVAVNTAAVARPALIDELAKKFGSQCVVGSLHAKKLSDGNYQAYTEYGREAVSLDLLEWCKELQGRGAGEILLTSVDRDGRKNGFDLELISRLNSILDVPLVVSGGGGSFEHVLSAFEAGADGVALASLLHYEISTIEELKQQLKQSGIEVRIDKNSASKELS